MKDIDLIQEILDKKNKCKISFTGTHGTGKTTNVLQTALDFKMNFPKYNIEVFTENAKYSPYKINKEACEESQLWIFTNQIQQELYLLSKSDILITDRTCIDSIAYSYRRGFKQLANKKLELVKSYIHSYDIIYFKSILNNNYCFEDNTRIHNDDTFREEIEEILLELYHKLSRDIRII